MRYKKAYWIGSKVNKNFQKAEGDPSAFVGHIQLMGEAKVIQGDRVIKNSYGEVV